MPVSLIWYRIVFYRNGSGHTLVDSLCHVSHVSRAIDNVFRMKTGTMKVALISKFHYPTPMRVRVSKVTCRSIGAHSLHDSSRYILLLRHRSKKMIEQEN